MEFEKGITKSQHHYSLIIASAFSMMILLLTFTVESRNLLLDLGLTCLFLSIIFLYQLYNLDGFEKNLLKRYEIDKNGSKLFETLSKKVNKGMVYNVLGLDSFFLGLLFIFLFFKVSILTIISIVYVNYLMLRGIFLLNKIRKPMLKVELTVLVDEIKNLNPDIVKSIKKSLYFSLMLMILVEIINLMATFYTILFLINLFLN